jgi:hypothetical protein
MWSSLKFTQIIKTNMTGTQIIQDTRHTRCLQVPHQYLVYTHDKTLFNSQSSKGLSKTVI